MSCGWQLNFNAPNRYHVTQAIWDEDLSDDLLDEWITVGSDHYQKIGFWIQVEEARQENLNRLLLAEKYLEVLRAGDSVSASVYRGPDSRYLLLTYQPATVGELLRWAGLSEEESLSLGEWTGKPQLSIWIDLETCLLAKALCDLEGKEPDGKDVQIQVQQMFASFDEDLWVNSPEQYSVTQ